MKRIMMSVAALCLLAACSHGSDREKQISDIETQEANISAMDVNTQDEDLQALIADYTRFVSDFSDDSLAPVYLQRAADLSLALDNTDRALSLLDSVVTLYPGYEDIGGCYFLKGYVFEVAERYEEAREAYTYFVDNYPSHPLADDTRKTIQYIGMSPEEMLEAILGTSE